MTHDELAAADQDRRAADELDPGADSPTSEGLDVDPNEFDPGAEPASRPDPDPEALADELDVDDEAPADA